MSDVESFVRCWVLCQMLGVVSDVVSDIGCCVKCWVLGGNTGEYPTPVGNMVKATIKKLLFCFNHFSCFEGYIG